MSKKRRRGKGEGSIYKRKDGRYEGSVTIGYNANGNPKRKRVYGKTRTEVQEKLNKIIYEINTGTFIEPTKITLGEWLQEWLKGRKPHLEESTWTSYEIMIRRHINPVLGNTKLKNLQPHHLRSLYNEKLENGRVDGKGGLSPRAVHYIHSIINAALKQAIKERLINFNVAEVVELPKMKKHEMRPLNDEEIDIFLDEASKTRHYTAYMLELGSGLRRGELLGLKWQNVNLEEGKITVLEQLVRSKEKGLIIKNLKTKSSRRTIPLPSDVAKQLKVYRKQQLKEKMLLGPAYQDNDLVFCNPDGKPYDPRAFTKHFERLVKRAALPEIRFHDLRHTYATQLLKSGVHVKVAQQLLGHSSITMTLDTYSHVMPGLMDEAAERLNGIFKRKTPLKAKEK